jgi:hypothetical protein
MAAQPIAYLDFNQVPGNHQGRSKTVEINLQLQNCGNAAFIIVSQYRMRDTLYGPDEYI